jgi:ferredoxin
LNLKTLIAARTAQTQVYACGPERLLTALVELMSERPECLHVEHFTSTGAQLDPDREIGSDVELQDTKLLVHVAPDQTLLQALWAVGVDVASDCEEGLCGTCEVHVLDGEVDHRDMVLSAPERAASSRMMVCCSRAKSKKLVLAL